MPRKERPTAAPLQKFKKQAKQLLKDYKSNSAETSQRIGAALPRLLTKPEFLLADAQSVVARENGFDSWRKLIRDLSAQNTPSSQDLEQAHHHFAIKIGGIFSELHNTDIVCNLDSIRDSKFDAYFNTLSSQRWVYTFHLGPMNTPAIIDFSDSLIWGHIYRESGGLSGDMPKTRRELSVEEYAMMASPIKLILNRLVKTWNANFSARFAAQTPEATLRQNAEDARIVRHDANVSTLTMTVSSDKVSGTLKVCYPEKLVKWALYPERRSVFYRKQYKGAHHNPQLIEVVVPADVELEDGMVYVDAGSFMMGDDEGRKGEGPFHKVELDAFWIDRFPVTNEDYARFVNDTGYDPPGIQLYEESLAKYPVVGVSYENAQAYAAWAGKRLPTEAEWEKAARGKNGQAYPWGSIYEHDFCNADGRWSGPTPVNQFPDGTSPYGAVDMCGNVLEWVSDWYDAAYYTSKDRTNPKGPAHEKYRCLRGGFYDEGEIGVRCAARFWASQDARQKHFGFRCAKDVLNKPINKDYTPIGVKDRRSLSSISNGGRMLSKNQQVKIDYLHKSMAKRMAVEYTNRNRHVTDVHLGFSDQTTFGEVILSLSNPCHAYQFKLTPLGAYCVIDYELTVRNEFLALNGLSIVDGVITDDQRRFMASVVRQDLTDLEAAWHPIEHMQVADVTIEQDKDHLNVIDRGETVILLAFECHMQHASGLIRIVYPRSMVESYLEKIEELVIGA